MGSASERPEAESSLAELDQIDTAKLSRENHIDAAILKNRNGYSLWSLRVEESWAWDPAIYNEFAGGAIFNLMARDYAPMRERLVAAAARMEKLPAFYAQERANLVLARVPKIHAETVAKQNNGILSLVD
jgi:Bacterial protein of unknown function (DUF885)